MHRARQASASHRPTAAERPGSPTAPSRRGCLALLAVPALAGVLATALPQAVQAQPSGAGSERLRDYVIGAGDMLRVSVYQNPDLQLETRVSETGQISFPLLGTVRLGGLSSAQAEKLIADGLRGGNYIRNPQVSVVVLQVRGNQASVLGMVNKPGRYPIEVTGMRLTELLATAGGVAVGGADVVVLSGVRDGKPIRRQVDIASLLLSGELATDPVVQHGDVVYVDRMPMVYIYGEVQRPGSMRLERDMTLMQALASGGGLTPRGTERGIKLHRRDPYGQVKVLEPDMLYKLQDGDVIQVRASLF